MLLLHRAPLIARLPRAASHWRSPGHVTRAWTDRRTGGMEADGEKKKQNEGSSAFPFSFGRSGVM